MNDTRRVLLAAATTAVAALAAFAVFANLGAFHDAGTSSAPPVDLAVEGTGIAPAGPSSDFVASEGDPEFASASVDDSDARSNGDDDDDGHQRRRRNRSRDHDEREDRDDDD